MVDDVRVQRLLRQVSDTVAHLAREAAVADEIRAQRRWLDSLKYNFIAAIECCVDVAQHLCAAEGWGPPASNADAFRLLHRHGVLSAPLAEDMARANGFRNVLVHEYVTVKDDTVIANLDRLPDLRDFVSEVARWLSGRADRGAR